MSHFFLPVKPTISPVLPEPLGNGNGNQGFIGMEFEVATSVRCVRLFQTEPRDEFERDLKRSWSAGFALQKWTGGTDTVGMGSVESVEWGGVLTWIRFIRWGVDENRLYDYIYGYIVYIKLIWDDMSWLKYQVSKAR